MRGILALLVGLAVGSPVTAQTPVPPPTADTGEVSFGLRLTGTDGDGARAMRLSDLSSGPTVDRLRVAREAPRWRFDAAADHAGYRDQRFAARYERFGRLTVSGEWDQVPVFYGRANLSPFTEVSAGTLRLPDSTQAAVQDRTATIAAYGADLRSLTTRSRRDVARLQLDYRLTRNLGTRLALRSSTRGGVQPWGASFGFSNATEVQLPLDQRSTDLTAATEWSSSRGMARLAYDGSWFRNGVETLVWDNPLRATDQTYANAYSVGDGPSQGRMALSPDSSAHTVSAAGSLGLPARTRAYAAVSVGEWLQNEVLLPHTINTAIAPLPLARPTAEAQARVTAATYRVTSRPGRGVWLSGQYRLYDFDNRTPRFPVDQYVRLDGTVATSATGGSEPFGYTRHFVDLDASYAPWRHAALRAGYGQQRDDRTFRLFEETTDQTVRASVDTTGLSWGALRLQYDRSVRVGRGLDEEVLSDIGEQVSLRQFDIADRTRHRVSAIAQVSPWDELGFNATVTVGEENRPEAAFGLQDNGLRAYGLGVELSPSDAVGASLSYGFERYRTRQRSRQANPGAQFEDPTRDWWTGLDERVHTAGLQVETTRLVERTTVTGAYDYVGSRAAYRYTVSPVSTLVAPQPLDPVRNRFHTGRVDALYSLSSRLALGVGYRFDSYRVDDFALSPGTLNSPLIPTFVNTLVQWRDYDAHTGSVRLVYRW